MAHQASYPVATMCRVLDVSTSGYYAWRKRAVSQRSQADAILTDRFRTIHTRSKGTYGAPRIHAERAEPADKSSGLRSYPSHRAGRRPICGE